MRTSAVRAPVIPPPPPGHFGQFRSLVQQACTPIIINDVPRAYSFTYSTAHATVSQAERGRRPPKDHRTARQRGHASASPDHATEHEMEPKRTSPYLLPGENISCECTAYLANHPPFRPKPRPWVPWQSAESGNLGSFHVPRVH